MRSARAPRHLLEAMIHIVVESGQRYLFKKKRRRRRRRGAFVYFKLLIVANDVPTLEGMATKRRVRQRYKRLARRSAIIDRRNNVDNHFGRRTFNLPFLSSRMQMTFGKREEIFFFCFVFPVR